MFDAILYIRDILSFSSHNSWNSESSDSESEETENRKSPPIKSQNRRVAQKTKEKARARKKRISESSENSSFDSDDNRRYVFGKSFVRETKSLYKSTYSEILI